MSIFVVMRTSRRYLMVKANGNVYEKARFGNPTQEDIESLAKHSADFLGEFVCIYDLEGKRYIPSGLHPYPYELNEEVDQIVRKVENEYHSK